MRDTVEGFIARGGNAAFLSGNTAFWQVRIEDDGGDTMVGYKDAARRTTRASAPTAGAAHLDVVRPDHRAARDADDRCVLHRGGYARIGRRLPAARAATPSAAGALGLRGHRARATATCSAPAHVVGYECDGASSGCATASRTRPARIARRATSRFLRWRRP